MGGACAGRRRAGTGGRCLRGVRLKGLVSIIREGEGFEERVAVGSGEGGGFQWRGLFMHYSSLSPFKIILLQLAGPV